MRCRICPPARLKALLELLQAAAVALDNAARIEHAEALSVTDDLTNRYNSRYLTQALRREAKRTTRSHQPLSLLFIDMDGFKHVNDQHGHLFGSRSLIESPGSSGSAVGRRTWPPATGATSRGGPAGHRAGRRDGRGLRSASGCAIMSFSRRKASTSA